MIEALEIRNENRVLIDYIDAFDTVIWSPQYYGAGAFELTVDANKKNAANLTRGRFITRTDSDRAVIIEGVRSTYTRETGRQLVITGRFAKSILDRRLIYNLSGTTVTPTVIRGNVEDAARALVNSHIISSAQASRNVPFLKLGAKAGAAAVILDDNGSKADKQTSYANLLTYTDELLQEYGLGAYMSFDRTTANLLYTVYEGKDRRANNAAGNAAVLFSQTFDTLLTSEYTEDDMHYKNTALIGGAGEGAERFYSMIGINATGMNRREVFVDASSQSRTYKNESDEEIEYTPTEYAALLQTHGKQTLAQLEPIQTFFGSVDLTNCRFVFGRDYFLGDMVTVRDVDINKQAGVRVVQATEIQDSSGYTLELTYETI